jgi:hypothetical protein
MPAKSCLSGSDSNLLSAHEQALEVGRDLTESQHKLKSAHEQALEASQDLTEPHLNLKFRPPQQISAIRRPAPKWLTSKSSSLPRPGKSDKPIVFKEEGFTQDQTLKPLYDQTLHFSETSV